MSAAEQLELQHVEQEIDSREQYLTFMLAGEEYGLDILRVQEIKGWDAATKIPNTPAYIKGVINIRGTIVPIVDLRKRFGLDNLDYGVTTVVIVLKVLAADRQRIMGIVVDAVSDVYNLEKTEMKPPPDFGTAISIEFVQGLATVDEQMVIMLDVDKLLNSEGLAVIDKHVSLT